MFNPDVRINFQSESNESEGAIFRTISYVDLVGLVLGFSIDADGIERADSASSLVDLHLCAYLTRR